MKHWIASIFFLLVCLALFPVATNAQEQEKCAAEVNRQFDFLLGHWEVRDSNGKKLGENRIEKILNGCVIAENWQGNNNHVGHSYIMFDARRKLWHQTWVDNSGFLMVLEGDFQNGVMLMNSRAQYDLQGRERHRVTWKPLAADRLERIWEMSSDRGNSWRTSIKLRYSKKSE